MQAKLAICALCALALLGAAQAGASEVAVETIPGSSDKQIVFRGSPGEANLAWASDGATEVYFQQGVEHTITIVPTAPCWSATPGTGEPSPEPTHYAICPRSGAVRIAGFTGEGDDVFGAGMSFTMPAFIDGGAGNDNLGGSHVDDVLLGGAGNDTLSGDLGGDRLDGGPGADAIYGRFPEAGGSGEDGVDVVDYASRTAPVTVTLDGRADDGEAGEADNVGRDVEDVIGGAAGDTISGSELSNRLEGGGGNDTLNVRGGGTDTVVCGPGTDTVVADDTDTAAADCETVQTGEAAADTVPPNLSVVVGSTRLGKLLRPGLALRVGCSEACTVAARLMMPRRTAVQLGIARQTVAVGRGRAEMVGAGRARMTVRLTRRARTKLRRVRRVRLRLEVRAMDTASHEAVVDAGYLTFRR